jgi:thiamine-phosphate pyrophosphorylase
VTLPKPPLLVVTDRAQAQRPLADVVQTALAAGCRWISLREKDLPAPDQLVLAKRLLPIARQFGARLTVHGDAETARACNADGVHLPAGGDPRAARALLGPDKLVGLSIHTAREANAIDPAVVDYAIAGPAYPSNSKPGYGPALELAGLQSLIGATTVPVIAIGGIEPATVADVFRSGAAGIAVMGSVMRAADAGAAVTALLRALDEARDQPRAR